MSTTGGRYRPYSRQSRYGGPQPPPHSPLSGNTPLHLAVKSQAVEAEAIVDVILKGSVDVNVQNAAGATPLDLAVSETVR